MKIYEIFTQPLPFHRSFSSNSGYENYVFTFGQRTFVVNFCPNPENQTVTLSLMREGWANPDDDIFKTRNDIKTNPAAVYAAVFAIVQSYIAAWNPPAIIFSAADSRQEQAYAAIAGFLRGKLPQPYHLTITPAADQTPVFRLERDTTSNVVPSA